MDSCTICGNPTANRLHTAREMMYGLREEFPYLECAACGCLQIVTVPPDMQRFYPAHYYSFRTEAPRRTGGLSGFLRRARARYCLLGANRLPGLRSRRYDDFEWFKKTRTTFRSRILDVGCGSGSRLLDMAGDGFTDLTGQDLFVPASVDYGNGVRILKCGIADLPGPYDLIMLHHSFEHMPEPLRVLQTLRNQIAPGGFMLICVPVVAWAWRHYGTDWVGVDAPRHLFLYTERGLRHLAGKAGLDVVDVVYDSGALQFWASELIHRGLPWMESTETGLRSGQHHFGRSEIRAFKRRARELNRARDGDAACFYLRRREETPPEAGPGDGPSASFARTTSR